MAKVYLSGGMRSEWRDQVRAGAPDHKYFDPTTHGQSDPDLYTAWDFLAVKMADVVFAYMEETNPSGIGLAAEVAYAMALGKTVILVDLKQDKSMAIVRSLVTVNCKSLENGIDLLHSMESLRG
jgi:hypothetical protein